MRILIPVFGFAASGGGRVLSEFATRIKAKGHEVSFLSFGDSISPYFPTKADIIWVNYNGVQIGTNNLKRINFPLKYFFIRRRFRKIIEKFGSKFDVVLATHSLTALPVFKAKITARKFYYIQAYETEYYEEHYFKHMLYKIAVNASYKLDLKRIVNSELYLDYKGIKAERYVYPGLDPDIFYPKAKSSNNDKLFKMGCIGRIEKVKGTHLVLEALQILRMEYADIELHIAFGSEELAAIPGIKICKPKNDVELGDFYRSVDVVIAPGTVQLGAVHYPVLEAFACGTPVITTGYSHADENNSYIVPINNVHAIVKAVTNIKHNPEEASSKAELAKEVIPPFLWDIVTCKLISCLEEQ